MLCGAAVAGCELTVYADGTRPGTMCTPGTWSARS